MVYESTFSGLIRQVVLVSICLVVLYRRVLLLVALTLHMGQPTAAFFRQVTFIGRWALLEGGLYMQVGFKRRWALLTGGLYWKVGFIDR